MRPATLLILTVCAATATASPSALIPRLDPDGLPLSTGATRRLGSGLFLTGFPYDLAFSPDCGVVYVANGLPSPNDGGSFGLTAWDAATGKPLWKTLARIGGVRIVPAKDDKTLWVAGYESLGRESVLVVAQVRAADGVVLSRRTIRGDGYVMYTRLSDTGRAVVRTAEKLAVYDPHREKPIWTLPEDGTRPNQEFFLARDGKRLMTAHSVFIGNGTHSRLTGYDLPTGREVWSQAVEHNHVRLNAHPDGKRAWAQPYRRVTRLVQQPGGGAVQELEDEPAELMMWNLTDGVAEEPQRINRYPDHGGISTPQFRPGGKTAVANFDGGFAEFELPTWKHKRRLPEIPVGGPWWLSADGTTVAIFHGSLAMFDVDTGKLRAGRLIGSLAAEPMTFAGGRVTLAREKSGEKRTTFELDTGPGGDRTSPAFGPVAGRRVQGRQTGGAARGPGARVGRQRRLFRLRPAAHARREVRCVRVRRRRVRPRLGRGDRREEARPGARTTRLRRRVYSVLPERELCPGRPARRRSRVQSHRAREQTDVACQRVGRCKRQTGPQADRAGCHDWNIPALVGGQSHAARDRLGGQCLGARVRRGLRPVFPGAAANAGDGSRAGGGGTVNRRQVVCRRRRQ